MSELSEIKKGLDDLKDIVVTHIADTTRYRIERDKVVDAHSDSLWDKDGRAGALTKLDRLEISETNRIDKEKSRSKIIWGIITGFTGLILDKFFHFLPK